MEPEEVSFPTCSAGTSRISTVPQRVDANVYCSRYRADADEGLAEKSQQIYILCNNKLFLSVIKIS